MYRSLFESSKPMLQYKRQLALAGVGLVIMSLSFGAGLGLMLPIFKYLLEQKISLAELVDSAINDPYEQLGDRLAAMLPSDPFYGFMLVMLTLFVFTIIGGVGRFMHTYMVARCISRVIEHWRVKLFRKLVRMDMNTYWAYGMADGSSRILTDVNALRNGITGILVRSAQAGSKVVISLTLAFFINWQLTLIALVGGPVIVVVIRKFGKSIRKAAKHTFEANSQMLTRMNESLADLRVIKMSQSENAESRSFMRTAQFAFREQVRQYRVRAMSSMVVEALAMVGVIGVAGLSAHAIFNGNVDPSEFMMVLALLVAAGTSFKPLSNLHHDLTASDAAAQRILELSNRITTDTEGEPADLPKLSRHAQSIVFDKISYTYPGAKTRALTEVSFEVPFGQMVAIVGGNGSGKSTLVAALTRLIKPESGRMLVDGKDIREHTLRSVRSQMAMVTQKTKLFKGSIADNIAYGRSWARHQDIVAAAKAATADLFIDEMPDRYDTKLGEGGEGVSGGQAQRICIARAVLRNPAILILDEATSQVDTTSEALIAEAMEHITQGRTTFVIAHRMSTIVHADRIVVMDEGRVVGIGKHAELLDTCPQYEALAKAQFATAEDG